MNIAIWGAGKNGKAIVDKLAEDIEVKIHCIIDYDIKKQGKKISDIPIVSKEKFARDYKEQIDKVIISVAAEYFYVGIVDFLRDTGVYEVGFLKDGLDFSMEKIHWINANIPFFPHVEMHVMDSCNLKCKGCTHFSNLYSDYEIYPLETFSKDLQKLSEQVCILRFWLLGGEPFLNPDLKEYIKEARRILPDSEIKLVSNGLLIPTQNESVFEMIRRCDVTVDISGYPPTMAIKDKIVECLEREQIAYQFREEVKTFFALLGKKPKSDPMVAQEHCCDRTCHLLRNGRLYKCPVDGLMYKYKERFSVLNFPESEGLDIYADDFLKNMHRLEEAISLCRYCAEEPRRFTWAIAREPQVCDWMK